MARLPRFASTSLALSNKAYVSFGAPSGLNGLQSFTVEAWVQLSTIAGFQSVIAQVDLAKNTGSFQIYVQGGYVYAYYPSAPYVIASPQPIVAGQWTYLAATFDATSKQLTLYVNGLEAAHQSLTGTTLITSYPLLIGSVLQNGQPTWFLQGNVGWVAVWSSARTADEILSDGSNNGVLNAVAASTLEIYVDFTNPPAVDQSGAATPVQYKNGAQFEIAVPGLTLDGTSAYADVGGGSLLDLSGSASYTIEGWFFANGNGALASRASPSGTEYEVDFVSKGSGPGTVTFTRGRDSVSSSSLPTKKWYHFAASYDTTDNVLNLYVDGNLQASLIATGSAPRATVDTLLGASSSRGSASNFFTGSIQNVRFWNLALTQSDIRQWVNNQPVAGPSLRGSFDFTVDPPIDTTDQSTITLVAPAAVGTQTIGLDPASPEAVLGTVSSINADYLNQAFVSPGPPPAAFAVAAQPELWSDEHREASWQAILEALPGSVSEERQARLRSRFESGFAEAQRRFQENPDLGRVFSKVIENGTLKLIHHSPQGDVLVWDGAVGAISDCTLLWLQFIYMLTLGFLGAIGLAPTPFSVASNITTRIYNLVLANAAAVAALTSLSGMTITAASAIQFVKVLYKQGLIWPILKFALTALGWWALVWVLKQIIAILTGVAAAAALAGFIGWAAQLAIVARKFPSTCGPRASATA